MSNAASIRQDQDLEHKVVRARKGDRKALEAVVRAIQPEVYALALRFLWQPQDAEDATQEVLIRIISAIKGFHGNSRFRTWVYRVACNKLLTLRKQGMEQRSMSFDEFGEDLAQGLSDNCGSSPDDADRRLLLEEVKIGCTSAMLMCLDRNHRLAYILGEIVELDHVEAAEVLEVNPTAFRKRLSRARESISSFMMSRCGLANPANACRCRRRVASAVKQGRVDPDNLIFATSSGRAKQFPQVLIKIRQLEETRRAAALYRSHPTPKPSKAFIAWLKSLADEKSGHHIDSGAA